MTNRLRKSLEHLCQLVPADGASLTDGQLLARFVACRDECAFAALVRRHGPMVLGVCRRVLRHEQDAEDAFQATFLVLARKAASVLKRDSVGSWLYGVACRVSLQARVVIARRRAREKLVDVLPQPEAVPPEVQDWRPLLDRELARLPEKYRAAVVLCDLEGLPRREAADRLSLAEGTLSSRLATARRLLAKRLARCGFSFSGGTLAVILGEGTVRAVPAPLIDSTVKAVALAAAGQLAAVPTPAALLMKGVLQTMFLKKVRLVLGVVMGVAVLAATGVAYRAGGRAIAADKPSAGKPADEVEALRKEVELLRLNLLVVLEKVRSQEAELRALRGTGKRGGTPTGLMGGSPGAPTGPMSGALAVPSGSSGGGTPLSAGSAAPFVGSSGGGIATSGLSGPSLPFGGGGKQLDALKQAEDALKALRSTSDPEAQSRAVDALEKALQRLKSKKPTTGGGLP